MKMLEETGTKVSISTVKRVLYRHNLKGRPARKKPLLQKCHKKVRLRFATAHGDKRSYFLEKCPLVWWNKNRTVWPQWPSLYLEEKAGGLQAEEHHPNREARGWQHHVVGVLCCRRDWCTSQNRWRHEAGKLCRYIEATSQVKAWSQMGLPNGQWPQSYFQCCGKWLMVFNV